MRGAGLNQLHHRLRQVLYGDQADNRIYGHNGNFSISLCGFTENTAQDEGGAIRFFNATVDVDGSTFLQNSAQNEGGAIYLEDCAADVGAAFAQNYALAPGDGETDCRGGRG